MRTRLPLPVFLVFLASACTTPVPEPYANSGDPERQLTITTEVEEQDIASKSDISALKKRLETDPPTRATLHCDLSTPRCKEARALLSKLHIPHGSEGEGDSITLSYERILGKNCDNSFKDNTKNNANYNHEAFGCSVRANMVQMVSDKQHFVNPGLLDYMDGEKAAQNYDKYRNPPENTEGSAAGGSSSSSLIGSSGSSSQ